MTTGNRVRAWIVTVGTLGLPVSAAAQRGEYVTVQKVTDDTAIIVRSTGATYVIEKGVGCLSLWRYEGKRVVINSPGLFLGVGSRLLIPDMDQECRIWQSDEIQGPAPSQLAPQASRSSASAAALSCHESSILSPVPFMGNDGEVFKLSDGSYWKVNYEYEYLYEYYPSVTICPATGRLVLRGKTLDVQQISPAAAPSAGQGDSTASPQVIESRIDGQFSGWDGETIFKLQNGQIWQQAFHAYKYRYAYSPEVLIYRSGSVYKMRVNGVDGEIVVRRLR